jgi:hypothetical protein
LVISLITSYDDRAGTSISIGRPFLDNSSVARREARKHWRGHVFRSWEEAEKLDVLFWMRIPVSERARVTWELSEELQSYRAPQRTS